MCCPGHPGEPLQESLGSCEAVSTGEMPCLEQTTCTCPSHFSVTRRKTGGELGEHLSVCRRETPVQKCSPPIGEGGDRQPNRPLHREEEGIEEGTQLRGET